MAPSPSPFPNLARLRRDAALADVLLAPGDGGPPMPAHAALLAAASGYCFAALAGAGAAMDGAASPPSAPRTLALPGLPRAGVAAALDHIYSAGASPVPLSSAADLLRVADYLDMPAAVRAAAARLREGLTPRTAVQALGLAAACGDAGDLFTAAVRECGMRREGRAAAVRGAAADPSTPLFAARPRARALCRRDDRPSRHFLPPVARPPGPPGRRRRGGGRGRGVWRRGGVAGG